MSRALHILDAGIQLASIVSSIVFLLVLICIVVGALYA